MLATGAEAEDVDAALAAAGNDGRVALVTLLAGVEPDVARERLAERRRLGARRAGRERMRLGVEAALVRGELVPGDVEVDDGVVVDVGLAGGSARSHRGARVRRPAGERLRRRRLPRGGERGLRARRRGAARRRGVTAYQPTFITARGERDDRRAARDAAERQRAARRRRAPRRAVPLARAARDASVRASARSGPAICSTGCSTSAA